MLICLKGMAFEEKKKSEAMMVDNRHWWTTAFGLGNALRSYGCTMINNRVVGSIAPRPLLEAQRRIKELGLYKRF